MMMMVPGKSMWTYAGLEIENLQSTAVLLPDEQGDWDNLVGRALGILSRWLEMREKYLLRLLKTVALPLVYKWPLVILHSHRGTSYFSRDPWSSMWM